MYSLVRLMTSSRNAVTGDRRLPMTGAVDEPMCLNALLLALHLQHASVTPRGPSARCASPVAASASVDPTWRAGTATAAPPLPTNLDPMAAEVGGPNTTAAMSSAHLQLLQ